MSLVPHRYGYFWFKDTRYYGYSNGRVSKACSQYRMEGDGDEQKMPGTRAKTITRPYYIGSVQMVQNREQGHTRSTAKPRYSKATLEDALIEARLRLAADQNLTEVSIVKIVRVVRRAKPVPPPSAFDIEVVE